MPQNIIDKIWQAHTVKAGANMPDIIFIDWQLLHEVTSPQAFTQLRKANLSLFAPARHTATIDHSIPTDPQREHYADILNKKQVEQLQQNCRDFGVKLYDCDSGHQGIVHVTGPELGITQPGMTIVCGDSHTATHGAFGALAFGVGTTQIAHVMATSCLLLHKPKTMRVEFVGTPSKYFSAKDAILQLIAQIGVEGGNGHVIEYTGEYIRSLSMEERMTICNMSIECGARAGLVAPDATTLAWLADTPAADKSREEYWLSWASDAGAEYDTVVTVDIDAALPRVTWGTTPSQSVAIDDAVPVISELSATQQAIAVAALDYTGLMEGAAIAGTLVQHVFIGSCTNGRLSDLQVVADVLRGRRVADGVTVRIVPGSEQVEQAAIATGLDKIFIAAGAQWRRPGCSSCLAMNGDTVPAGAHCASTSNRNFVGRQGNGAITHLMSPLLAGIAAVTGQVTDPREFFAEK